MREGVVRCLIFWSISRSVLIDRSATRGPMCISENGMWTIVLDLPSIFPRPRFRTHYWVVRTFVTRCERGEGRGRWTKFDSRLDDTWERYCWEKSRGEEEIYRLNRVFASGSVRHKFGWKIEKFSNNRWNGYGIENEKVSGNWAESV